MITPDTLIRVGPVELDESTGHVRRDDNPVALTVSEFQVLRYLMANAGRVLTKAQIVAFAWDDEFDESDDGVRMCMYQLRRKLNLPGEQLIRTVRGVGYQLRTGR